MRPAVVLPVLSAALALIWLSCVGEVPSQNGGADANTSGRYHPTGYAASDVHGLEANLQTQNCAACHGQDLTGMNDATSCDLCHTPSDPQAWRSDCTFCHGGTDNMTGAPPGELAGMGDTKFGAHSAHLGSTMMPAMDCTDCHVKPTGYLDPGHGFDMTQGSAEVVFTAGRSPTGTYPAAQTCDNLYCHGDGIANGSVMATAGAMNCNGCHGEPPGSGAHAEHTAFPCSDCHNLTTLDNASILDPLVHIDTNRQVSITDPGTLVVNNNGGNISCDGDCHNAGQRIHQADTW